MSHTSFRSHILMFGSFLRGFVVLGAGMLVAGWVFDMSWPVRQISPFADVHFDTAIGLFLMALANVVPHRWRVASFPLIGVVVLSAIMTILGYVMRFSQPIDLVIEMSGLMSAGRSANLHMPFPTALALVLIGISLTLRRMRFTTPLQNTFALAAAATAALVMSQDLMSRLFLMPEPDLAETHDVALQSALLIILLAAELVIMSWTRLRAVAYRRLDHYLAWSTILLAATFLIAWEYQERNDWEQRGFETEVALQNVSSDLGDDLRLFGNTVQRLGSRWALYGTPTKIQWEIDARSMLTVSPTVFSIAYVDLNRIVRWRVARSGPQDAQVGVRLDQDRMGKLAFDTADRIKQLRMTQTTRMYGGGLVRLCLLPVFDGVTQEGYLMASLRLEDLPSLVPSRVMQDFNVEILDYSGSARGVTARATDIAARIRKSTHLESFGQYWTISVWPKESYIVAHRSRLLLPTLLFGGLITFLVAAALSQTRHSQINLRRAGEATARLATTLEHITDGFVTVGRDGTITYANNQAALITKRTKEGMVGHKIRGLAAEPDDEARNTALSLAMDGKGTGRFVTEDKETGRWLDATAYPTKDGIAMIFRDVTRERAKDEHLRLLENAVARQNDVLIITDAEYGEGHETQKIVYVNDAFTRLTGFSREEAIGKTPRIMQGPATSREGLDRIREAVKNRKPIQIELVNYAKDGSQYWIEMDIAPIFSDTGVCTHFVAVEREITQRKRIQAQVIYSQERFQHIVDATNDIIWDADLASGHVQYNENLKKILGYDPAVTQFTTTDWENWLHPDDRSRVSQVIADSVETEMPPVDMEYRLRKADGTYAIITDRAKVIRDTEGKPLRIVGTMADVTERRAMADRLRQAQQLEAVGQLTGGVAHDFNNLLTVILGNAELLADRLTSQPKLQKLAEMTVTMALRGAELTSRLLAFARRQPLEPKLIDVNRLITSMEDWMRRTLPESISITIQGDPDLWPIEADPNQLENALLNLAVNARDAMPEGGKLLIRTANREIGADQAKNQLAIKPGSYVCISVTDTGSGMDDETLARAFEPFFTTKVMGKGSGLGLSMVYGFVRQSAGFAQIESTPGHGTTVYLCFPRLLEGDVTAIQSSDALKVVGGSEHILAVEDDESVLDNVVAKLEGLGYRVSSALAGSAALEIIRQDASIDLLFTDIVMPGDMSGPELVKVAATIRPVLKVLYTSGYADDTIIHDGKLDEGVSLLTKPYRLADLAEKLRSVLDR